MQNATYLFKSESKPYWKNSESRWTAVAQMSLIFMSALNSGISLPIYISDSCGYFKLHPEKPYLYVSGFNCDNTVCECGLRGDIFNINTFVNDFTNIKPDILYVDVVSKHAIFIEVKTVGESVARNIKRYHDLEKHLREEYQWETQLYYLLSHGHETKKDMDWSLLSEKKAKIILWEDLLGKMAMTPLANLIGERLGNYCDLPAQRP